MTTSTAILTGLIAALVGLVSPNPIGEDVKAPHRFANLRPESESSATRSDQTFPTQLTNAPEPSAGQSRPEPTQNAVAASPGDACNKRVADRASGEEAGRNKIGRGDKVKLAFYEILKSLDQKWGAEHSRYQSPATTFQQHEELSNEYLVQDDGSIVVPLLGRFNIDGETSLEVKSQLECAFVTFLGRSAFVNVTNIVKRPVFVVGRVAHPGSVEFTPGMTVLQAVALAGGFEKTPIDPSAVAQLVRETERLRSAVDRAVRMMARTTAINAARVGGPSPTGAELSEIVGQDKSKSVVGDEFSLQETEQNALLADEASLKGAVDAARRQLELRKAAAPLLDETLTLRRNRVQDLSKLAANGSLGKPVLLEAQTELLDAEQRSQEAQNVVNQAQEQLNGAMRELETRKQQSATKSQREEAEARREAGEAVQETDAAADLIKVMSRVQFGGLNTLDADYKIVHRTQDGAKELPATGTTVLEPGDLVEVMSAVIQDAAR